MVRKTLTITLALLFGLGGMAVVDVDAQSKEGIQVRGHWMFEVFNPDGSLASRKEFDNALTTGARLLATLLTRSAQMGEWGIALYPSGPANPFSSPDVPDPYMGQLGLILEPTNTGPAFKNVFKTLTVARGEDSGTVVLKGSATALRGGTVTAVETVGFHCTGACPSPVIGVNTSGQAAFSSADVSQLLVAEQILQVTVTFSFSAAAHTATQQ